MIWRVLCHGHGFAASSASLDVSVELFDTAEDSGNAVLGASAVRVEGNIPKRDRAVRLTDGFGGGDGGSSFMRGCRSTSARKVRARWYQEGRSCVDSLRPSSSASAGREVDCTTGDTGGVTFQKPMGPRKRAVRLE